MTEQLQPRAALTTCAASLIDHPQRLGILPTWWFWNDPKNGRLVARWFGVLGAVIMLAVTALGPHPVIGGIIAGAVWVLAVGLFERYIRRQALKRHALSVTPEAGDD